MLLCCVAVPTIAAAGEKQYPVEGTVTAVGTKQEISGSGTNMVTHLHRTYTVKTPTRLFKLECPYWMDGLHLGAPIECGGSRKIQIGDTIHFRLDKDRACLQTDKGKEQKLDILSEEMKDERPSEASK